MPQVASSSLLQSVSPQVRRFQEAKFEIISSEASYLRSLNVLVSQFANSSRLRHNSQVISQEDWAAVFSNIYQVPAAPVLFYILQIHFSFYSDQRMLWKIPSVPGNMLAKVTLDQVNIFFRN